MKRLALLIIGDEILAGHTQDTNSHWLAKRCKQLGIAMRRIETCTDELPDIADSVRRMLHDVDVDYVVTSGGLGPTPDDRTMEGIAAALHVDLEMKPEDWEWMKKHVAHGHKLGYFRSSEPNDGMRKMAFLPAGAKAMPNRIGTCLGAIVETDARMLFTLPGVPREFERMFDETVVPYLETSEPEHVEELLLYTEESRFYEVLQAMERDFPDVTIGSYPQRGRIMIRITGDEDRAVAAMHVMRQAGKAYLEPRD